MIMASSVCDGDLNVQLHAWATKEMNFHARGAFVGTRMPTPEDFKSICRGTQQTDLWKYVIQHVCSMQTVKKVRGNLALHRQTRCKPYMVSYQTDAQYNVERQQLLEQRADLLQEVTSSLSDIHHLEREISRMSEDIQAAEQEYQRELGALQDVKRRTCLLGVFAAHCDNQTSQNEAFAEKIDSKIDALTIKETEPGFRPKSEKGVDELETTYVHQVRESCESIENFLHQTLQGSFSKDKSAFSVNKDQLWRKVEKTLSDNKIPRVLLALEQLGQSGARALREHTQRINLQQDAQKLRFKYEKGGLLRDASNQPTVLQSVQQLLEESQLQHVLRFVETEKHRNTAFHLLEGLETTRGKINSSLKKYLAGESENIELACCVVQAKFDLTADRTAAACLRQEAEALREKVAKGQAERGHLVAVHRKIQDFYDLANAKQNLIQVVAKQNAGAQTRLAAQKQEISLYIKRCLSGHESGIHDQATALKGTVLQEVDKFVSLSLPYLAYIYLDSTTKCGLLDLSINYNSHPAAIAAHQPLQAIFSHLEFPSYKACECVLHHCLQLKQEQESFAADARAQTASCQQVVFLSGIECNLDNITDLCDKVKAQDRAELENLLPRLQKRMSKAALASTGCITVKNHVQAWWEQPAQFVTPWLTAEGLTYQQWYNKWRIVITKIRQLEVQK